MNSTLQTSVVQSQHFLDFHPCKYHNSPVCCFGEACFICIFYKKKKKKTKHDFEDFSFVDEDYLEPSAVLKWVDGRKQNS